MRVSVAVLVCSVAVAGVSVPSASADRAATAKERARVLSNISKPAKKCMGVRISTAQRGWALSYVRTRKGSCATAIGNGFEIRRKLSNGKWRTRYVGSECFRHKVPLRVWRDLTPRVCSGA